MTENEAIKEFNKMVGDRMKTKRGISEKQHGLFQAAMDSLEEIQQYRAIGTVDQCREAIKRQMAKKPIKIENNGFRYTDSYICPNCEKGFTGTGIADFCYHCGQAI